MTSERYSEELSVLRRKLSPNLFRFLDMGTSTPHLVLAARTNRGNVYTLYVDLRGFPDSSPPKVFVKQMLQTRSGEDMDGCSAQMHTLASEHGWTRICHYGGESWTPYVSLYKIYIKCRLWLEMYEEHLATGYTIDTFLKHQY